MSDWQNYADTIVWSTIACWLGYALCSAEVVYEEVRMTSDAEERKDITENRWRKVVGGFVIAMSIVALVISVSSSARERNAAEDARDAAVTARRNAEETLRIAKCQTRVNTAVVDAIRKRGSIADRDRKALKNMLDFVLTDPPPQQAIQAIRDYTSLYERLSEQRPRLPSKEEAQCLPQAER